MTEKFENIVAVLSNESLADAFGACACEADAVKLLAENGVETTESELKEILVQIMSRANAANNSELSEEQLAQIAGGYSWGAFWKDFKGVMKSVGQAIGSLGMGGIY